MKIKSGRVTLLKMVDVPYAIGRLEQLHHPVVEKKLTMHKHINYEGRVTLLKAMVFLFLNSWLLLLINGGVHVVT